MDMRFLLMLFREACAQWVLQPRLAISEHALMGLPSFQLKEAQAGIRAAGSGLLKSSLAASRACWLA